MQHAQGCGCPWAFISVFMGVQMGVVGVHMGVQMVFMGVHGCSWAFRWVYMGVLWVFKAWFRP